MADDLIQTKLFSWLKKKDQGLASQILLIRQELAKWLPRIVQLFPHYPSHGLDHSDRITAQLSKLLFGSKTKPSIKDFSAAEAYCLLAAVYIHDMGMVASPEELERILISPEWKDYTGEGGPGKAGYAHYLKQQEDAKKRDDDLDIFLADAALRLLLADYIRRRHADRCKTTLKLHPYLSHLVGQGDPIVLDTIENLGASHGLPESDMIDENRFPEHRDLLGGEANVRLLARLLRIGDLLDMDPRRADPMAAIAAAPLPPDSIAHWDQYAGKKHESITPEHIKFRFECKNQETHRILRTWFGWLENEIQNTLVQQAHAARHHGWAPPRCIVSSQEGQQGESPTDPTILILPSKDANYAFHDWKLELDQEQVLERLIHDVYDSPETFVRELIQNALDATRCQMYEDFRQQNLGEPPPTKPTQFPEAFRETYPLHLSLEQEVGPDGASRWVFTIEDLGTGMSEHIITRYFLQVGRSYYRSQEFRQHYAFIPTSRFGVGFLSVFAVSDNVTVETAHRPESGGSPVGLRLNLRGPSSYLLTERWEPFPEREAHRRQGTRIRVVLRDELDPSLLDLVRDWCVRVEVPVQVRQGGKSETVRAFRLKDGEIEVPSRVNPDARFRVRVVDIESPQVEGQIALVAYEDEHGEGWCDCWSWEKNLADQRIDEGPELSDSFQSLHGITVSSEHLSMFDYSWRTYLDFRSDSGHVDLARTSTNKRHEIPEPVLKQIHTHAQGLIEEHFRNSRRCQGPLGYWYKGRVLSEAPVDDAWRCAVPGTILAWQKGKRVLLSAEELCALESLVLTLWPERYGSEARTSLPHPRNNHSGHLLVSVGDIPNYLQNSFSHHLSSLDLRSVKNQDDLWMLHFQKQRRESDRPPIPDHMKLRWFTKLPLGVFGICNDSYSSLRLRNPNNDLSVLNMSHPAAKWLAQVLKYSTKNTEALDLPAIEHMVRQAFEGFDFAYLLGKWSKDPNIPEPLRPPAEIVLMGSFEAHRLVSRRTGDLDVS